MSLRRDDLSYPVSAFLDVSFLRFSVDGKERAQSIEYRLMLVFSVMAEDDFSVYVYDFSFPALIIQETKLEKGWNGYQHRISSMER